METRSIGRVSTKGGSKQRKLDSEGIVSFPCPPSQNFFSLHSLAGNAFVFLSRNLIDLGRVNLFEQIAFC